MRSMRSEQHNADSASWVLHEQTGEGLPPGLHDLKHLWLKLSLLCVWALVSFCLVFFARNLSFSLGPWPLAYWVASQGAVLVFILILGVYCAAMNYFERQDAFSAAAAATAPEQDLQP